MRNLTNFTVIFSMLILAVLGCSAPKENSTTTTTNTSSPSTNNATSSEKPITINAKELTKAYKENEIAADEKYKNKSLTVTGKIKNIAETLGNITVQLEGHDFLQNVMCSFEESEKSNVAKLKNGQQVTLLGKGDGMTGGLYVGLQGCKIQ